MKPVENYFFKWIYHLKILDKQQLKETIKREINTKKEALNTIELLLNIIDNSYKKFKDWIRKSKYNDEDFIRHSKKYYEISMEEICLLFQQT